MRIEGAHQRLLYRVALIQLKARDRYTFSKKAPLVLDVLGRKISIIPYLVRPFDNEATIRLAATGNGWRATVYAYHAMVHGDVSAFERDITLLPMCDYETEIVLKDVVRASREPLNHRYMNGRAIGHKEAGNSVIFFVQRKWRVKWQWQYSRVEFISGSREECEIDLLALFLSYNNYTTAPSTNIDPAEARRVFDFLSKLAPTPVSRSFGASYLYRSRDHSNFKKQEISLSNDTFCIKVIEEDGVLTGSYYGVRDFMTPDECRAAFDRFLALKIVRTKLNEAA